MEVRGLLSVASGLLLLLHLCSLVFQGLAPAWLRKGAEAIAVPCRGALPSCVTRAAAGPGVTCPMRAHVRPYLSVLSVCLRMKVSSWGVRPLSLGQQHLPPSLPGAFHLEFLSLSSAFVHSKLLPPFPASPQFIFVLARRFLPQLRALSFLSRIVETTLQAV